MELVSPKLGDRIADPACGSAGFLLGALKYLVTQHTSKEYLELDDNGFLRGTIADKLLIEQSKEQLQNNTFFGFDIDPTMIRLGLMNLMMHGIDNPKIEYQDTLSKDYNENNIYDIVLANPPFTGSLDKAEINPSFSIKTAKTELLFVERIYKMLKIGGTAGVVVPQGVLFGAGKAFIEIRKILVDQCMLKTVISMPNGVFKPYAGVATAILVFTKGEKTESVWFYDMKSDGRSLDDKRNELLSPNGVRDFGDLHNIIQEFKKKKKNVNRTIRHFIVPVAEIANNDYDLSVNKYREDVYQPVEYDDPRMILDQLSNLEKDIVKGLTELNDIIR